MPPHPNAIYAVLHALRPRGPSQESAIGAVLPYLIQEGLVTPDREVTELGYEWIRNFGKCADCWKPHGMFVVLDPLWKQHGAGPGYLCFSCFEGRLGRKLVAEDLKRVPVNDALIRVMEDHNNG